MKALTVIQHTDIFRFMISINRLILFFYGNKFLYNKCMSFYDEFSYKNHLMHFNFLKRGNAISCFCFSQKTKAYKMGMILCEVLIYRGDEG